MSYTSLDQLKSFRKPNANGKNIWAFYHSGLGGLKPWLRRNLEGWLTQSGWQVILVDMVEGSPNHVFQYVEPTYFPRAFVYGTMQGSNIEQHYSDLVRLPVLHKYGGMYFDVSSLIVADLDDVFDQQGELDFIVFGDEESSPYHPLKSIENWAIASRANNPFVKRWIEAYVRYWEESGETNAERHWPYLDMSNYFWPDYTAHMLAADEVRFKIDSDLGWNGPEFSRLHMIRYSAAKHGYKANFLFGWDHDKLLAALLAPESTPESQSLIDILTQQTIHMKTASGHLGKVYNEHPEYVAQQGTVLNALHNFSSSPTLFGHPKLERCKISLGLHESIHISSPEGRVIGAPHMRPASNFNVTLAFILGLLTMAIADFLVRFLLQHRRQRYLHLPLQYQ